MFERFNSQKSDDIFVEAATNANARQEYIDKLVKSRATLTRTLTMWGSISVAYLAVEFMPSSSPPIIILAMVLLFGFPAITLLVAIVSNDLQIKFLKALEAGTKQISQTDN